MDPSLVIVVAAAAATSLFAGLWAWIVGTGITAAEGRADRAGAERDIRTW